MSVEKEAKDSLHGEIALSGVSAPNAFGVETSVNVIEFLLAIRKNDVELYLLILRGTGLPEMHNRGSADE